MITIVKTMDGRFDVLSTYGIRNVDYKELATLLDKDLGTDFCKYINDEDMESKANTLIAVTEAIESVLSHVDKDVMKDLIKEWMA